ncbi:hypothetical protein [Nocardioides zeae]
MLLGVDEDVLGEQRAVDDPGGVDRGERADDPALHPGPVAAVEPVGRSRLHGGQRDEPVGAGQRAEDVGLALLVAPTEGGGVEETGEVRREPAVALLREPGQGRPLVAEVARRRAAARDLDDGVAAGDGVEVRHGPASDLGAEAPGAVRADDRAVVGGLDAVAPLLEERGRLGERCVPAGGVDGRVAAVGVEGGGDDAVGTPRVPPRPVRAVLRAEEIGRGGGVLDRREEVRVGAHD